MNFWDRMRLEIETTKKQTAYFENLSLTDDRGNFTYDIELSRNLKNFADQLGVDTSAKDWELEAYTWVAYKFKYISTGLPRGRPPKSFDQRTHFEEVQCSDQFDAQVRQYGVDKGWVFDSQNVDETGRTDVLLVVCKKMACRTPGICVLTRKSKPKVTETQMLGIKPHNVFTARVLTIAHRIRNSSNKPVTVRDIAITLAIDDYRKRARSGEKIGNFLHSDEYEAKIENYIRRFHRIPDRWKPIIKQPYPPLILNDN